MSAKNIELRTVFEVITQWTTCLVSLCQSNLFHLQTVYIHDEMIVTVNSSQ